MVGVTPHAVGFEIRFWKGGKRKSEYRKTEAGAHKRAAILHERLVGKGAQAVKPPTVVAEIRASWSERLNTLTQEAIDNPDDEERQRLLRTVSTAASAAAKHLDNDALKERITWLEEQHRLAEARRRTGHNANSVERPEQAGPLTTTLPN